MVALDLDETIGSFSGINALFRRVAQMLPQMPHEHVLLYILSVCPEAFRPGMLAQLRSLASARDAGAPLVIVMFTNNNGSPYWPRALANAIGALVGRPVFDHVVGAHTVDGRVTEPGRTSQSKLLQDMFRCTGIQRAERVVFIDDQEHPGMRVPGVVYVRPAPYHCSIDSDVLVRRAQGSEGAAHN